MKDHSISEISNNIINNELNNSNEFYLENCKEI